MDVYSKDGMDAIRRSWRWYMGGFGRVWNSNSSQSTNATITQSPFGDLSLTACAFSVHCEVCETWPSHPNNRDMISFCA